MPEVHVSQLRINRREALKHRLATVYDLHQALWQCFPERPEARRDFLFRCDEAETELKVLLLSAEVPRPPEWMISDGCKHLSPDFHAGELFWFRLRANPTRRLKTGRLAAVTDGDELNSWLEAKGKRHGFALRAEAEYSSCRLEQFSKNAGGAAISLNVVDISGVLAVTDGEAFNAAFSGGIGRGRAFGCGMLLLKRIEM